MISLGGVTHFFNEELLLPYWLRHHKDVFDKLILIDYASTDDSVAIIMDFIYTHNLDWLIQRSTYNQFHFTTNDPEVMLCETKLNTDWKLALNTTEFVWDANFKETLERLSANYERHNIPAFGMRSYVMVDNAEQPLDDRPLWLHRHHGFWDGGNDWRNVVPTVRRWRYVHNQPHGNYQTGRHGINLPHINCLGMSLLWSGYSPWEQCAGRKLQIQTRMEGEAPGMGWEHRVDMEGLRERYNEYLKISQDLLEIEDFARVYNEYKTKYEDGRY